MEIFIRLYITYIFAADFSVHSYSLGNNVGVSAISASGLLNPTGAWIPLVSDMAARSATTALDSLSGLDSLLTQAPQNAQVQPSSWLNNPTMMNPVTSVIDGATRSALPLDTTNTGFTGTTSMFNDLYGSISSATSSTTDVRSGLLTPTNMVSTTMPVQSSSLLPSNTIVPRTGALPTTTTPTFNSIGPATQSVSVTTPSITFRTVKTSVLPSIVQTNTAYHSNVHHQPTTPIIQKIFVPVKVPMYKPKPKMIKKFRMKHTFNEHGHEIITVPIGGPHDKYRQSYYGPYMGRANEFSFDYGPYGRRHMLRPIRNRRFRRMRGMFDFDGGLDDF